MSSEAKLQRLLDLLDQESLYTKERSAQVGKIEINADPSTGGGARTRNNPLFLPTGIDAFRISVVNSLGIPVTGAINFSPGQSIAPGSNDFETLGNNDVRIFKFRQSGCNFWWNAQVGLTITIFYYVGLGGELGTLGVNLLNNSVVVTGGTAADDSALGAAFNQTSITVAGTTVLIGQDTSRKSVTFQVNGGDIWIGTTPVVGGPGIKIVDGATFVWENTAALSAVNASGVPVVTGIVES